jgi:isocitrate dehydrogenase (NAD+)
MKHTITFIAGDGIGPEVSTAARRCVDAAADAHEFDVEWDEQPAGEEAHAKSGSLLPERTLSSIKRNGVALKGPITTPVGHGFRSINVELRQRLDLFANVRPAKLIPGIFSRYENVDIVIVRENTEDLYLGIEYDRNTANARRLIGFAKRTTGKVLRRDSAIGIKPISAYGSRRIAEFAFDYAKRNKRGKVTAVHKANIMKFTDGLFLREAQRSAERHKGIEFEDRIVDNMCMQLVIKPELYDILLCPNLYGDILSDLCAGLVGGLGIAPSGNIGTHYAVFEPVHGSAPKYRNEDKVNPTATILSAAMMLEHIGEGRAAKAIEKGVAATIKEGKHLTYDLKPKNPAGTKEMTVAIIKKIKG